MSSQEVDSIRKKMNDLNVENQELTEKVKKLEIENLNLRQKIDFYTGIEKTCNFYQKRMEDSSKEISELKAKIIEIEDKNRKDVQKMKIDFFKENTSLKSQQENNLQKIQDANIILKLNYEQEEMITDLQDQIKKIKEQPNSEFLYIGLKYIQRESKNTK